MSAPDSHSYYRQVTDLDIGEIARELLGSRVTQESRQTLYCDCPNHSSQSHRSLQVSLEQQCWLCWGCGLGGDVLQLVEFVRHGVVTRGQTGRMPESHRRARDFLAARVGLPPLSKLASPEEAEESYQSSLRVRETLTAIAEAYHQPLMANTEVLAWFRTKYGIGADMMARLKIGFADNAEPSVARTLMEGPGAFTMRDLTATSAFRPTAQDGIVPFFDGRIVFPYWSRGQVVFMIGRRTPWTPDHEWEKSKYKKLAVRNGRNNEYVAACIRNDVLYNEDVFLTRPERIIITEGVTDCISLMEHGFPVVSPVTVQIREADWERLLPKLRGVKTVYVCQDNEISEAGLQGALKTARVLADQGIATRVAVLPLGEKQRAAREKLAAGSTETDELLADAKIDVNEFFASGKSAADFEAILVAAQTPLEFAISRLPADGPEDRRNQLLEPILAEVASMSPLEQARYLKLIQQRCRKSVSIAVLRAQVRAMQKERGRTRKAPPRERQGGAQPESCRAQIADLISEAIAAGESPDFAKIAEAAFQWLSDHGARFFRTPQGQPFLFFEDELLWMDTADRGQRRLYLAKMYNQTGIVPTDTAGRTFYEVLANLAVERGEIREQFSWIHSDIAHYTIYFSLSNENREIVRISPDSIEVLKNGGNADGIILTPSNKMAPIHFLPDADAEEADRQMLELVIQNMTCQPADRIFALSWLSCFLLIDFPGTKPMLRFEGPSGSAKTTASKLLTTLIYGSAQQKKSTDAANYTDGARNPFIALDNIEAKQLTEELATFITTVVTGISKEKRKSGTDTDNISEQPKCLLNTTGIEPLGGEYLEIMQRTFIVRFDITAGSDCFLESKVLSGIREKRDLILSAMMKRTQQVLKLMRDGALERVMKMLAARLGDHNKRRCNDYLSLMYLMLLAGERPEVVEASLKEPNPRFLDSIASLNSTTLETTRESNSIATALGGLFKAYRLAAEADRDSTAMNVVKSNKAAFLERYQLEFADERTIQDASARDLYLALKRVAKEFSLVFPMNTTQQFVQRLANDLSTIREAGFDIRVNALEHRYRTYDIIRIGD